MEWWIVLAAVIGGFVGYWAGFSTAVNRGSLIIAILVEAWGKTEIDVKKTLDNYMKS